VSPTTIHAVASVPSVAPAETIFGQRVRAERESRGWTQADLAQRLAGEGIHLHPSAIAKIEDRAARRPRMIRLDEARALATVFGISLDQMLSSKDDISTLLADTARLLTTTSFHQEPATALIVRWRDIADRIPDFKPLVDLLRRMIDVGQDAERLRGAVMLHADSKLRVGADVVAEAAVALSADSKMTVGADVVAEADVVEAGDGVDPETP
jgi:transcriptional regulator with XRE-family HTH domain